MIYYIIIALLLIGGAGAYWWRNDKASRQQETDQAKITELQSEVASLKKAAEASTNDASADTPAEAAAETPAEVPTAAVKENVIASIKSGNTAALEGYMASTVSVIIAASEGVGDRTPTEAISDLAYLDSATDPWDFALPAATLTGYQTGDYKAYFKTNSVVGKSADGKVVSFNFSSAGKINGIFMSVSDDLL